MANAGTKGEKTRSPAEILRLIVTPGGLPAPDERADEVWYDHVRAGEFFNCVVANARMSSYFERAVSGVVGALGASSQPADEGVYDLDYIVPGDEPEAEADRFAYWLLFQSMKAREETVAELRRAVRRYQSNSFRPVIAGKGTNEEQGHVERRQGSVAIVSQ